MVMMYGQLLFYMIINGVQNAYAAGKMCVAFALVTQGYK